MGLAGAVNELLDRILLQEWLPEGFYPGKNNYEAIGIYSACYKLAIFMTLVIQAFRYAAEPFFFSQAAEKDSPQTFALIMKWFVIACAFIFLFISANLEDFAFLFLRGADYREGIMVVPVLLLANLFLGVYYNLSVWFKLTDKTKYGTYISFGGAAITILFNLLLAIWVLPLPHLYAILAWRWPAISSEADTILSPIP
jgi:O-antigen/teichoic acid export membrane protein